MGIIIKAAEATETLSTVYRRPDAADRGTLRGPRPTGPRPSGGEARGKAAISMKDLLVWTYRAQKVHLGSGGGVGAVGYASISQTGAVIDRLSLGCYVSGGGLRASPYPEDALTVHSLVTRMLTGQERRTVVGYAESDRVPDWSPAIPPLRCLPMPGNKGRPKGIYDRHGNLIGCELRYAGYARERAAALIEHARSVYRAWHLALTALCYAMQSGADRLRQWVVTGVGAEPAPWRA